MSNDDLGSISSGDIDKVLNGIMAATRLDEIRQTCRPANTILGLAECTAPLTIFDPNAVMSQPGSFAGPVSGTSQRSVTDPHPRQSLSQWLDRLWLKVTGPEF